MAEKLTTIAFDADDTLWHNEQFFRITQDRFFRLLADHADPDHLDQRLLEAERRNVGHYGFGIKGFMLSMIETAIEVTDSKVPASVIAEIIAAGQEMLRHPIELLPHAREAVEAAASRYRVLLITKGDLRIRNASWRSRAWESCSTGSRSCRRRRPTPTAPSSPAMVTGPTAR